MSTVASILASKDTTTVHWTPSSASAKEAASQMAFHRAGALLVIDGGNIVGLLAERDFVMHAAGGGQPDHATVADLMCKEVVFVRPEQTDKECMMMMTQRRLRHLPVRDGWGQLKGILSLGDLVKHIISDQDFTIQQLQQYIIGDVAQSSAWPSSTPT